MAGHFVPAVHNEVCSGVFAKKAKRWDRSSSSRKDGDEVTRWGKLGKRDKQREREKERDCEVIRLMKD